MLDVFDVSVIGSADVFLQGYAAEGGGGTAVLQDCVNFQKVKQGLPAPRDVDDGLKFARDGSGVALRPKLLMLL